MEKSSSKKYIVAALAAFVLLGGSVAFYLNNKTVVSGTTVPAVTPEKNQPVASSGTSLKDLLTSTGPTKCSVTTSTDKADSTGMVYIADGKMRTDFTNTMKVGNLAGKVQVAHMIVDTDYSYMWGDGEMKFGIKMAKQEILDVQPGAGNSPQNEAAIDMNEKSDYKCGGWKIDERLFTPPSDIQFQDMSAMMKSMPSVQSGTNVTGGAAKTSGGGSVAVPPGMSATEMSAMCGQCDQAGEGRDQCRAALGCK
jgi:hypothetical protein